jgi:hypothetical protein
MDIQTQSPARIPVFEYYHLLLSFQPEDHVPVRIYAYFGEKANRALISFESGVFRSADIEPVMGHEPLDEEDRERFGLLMDMYLSDIVRAWIDHFVFHKSISREVIMRRIN